MKYICDVCGYVYDEAAGDPDNGIAPGTTWAELPEDFVWSALRSRQRGFLARGIGKRAKAPASAGAFHICRFLK